jgi:predicted dehydrogenase
MKRRNFLQKATQTGAALITTLLSTPALSADRIAGAGERVSVALIGCGGRGRFLSRHLRAVPNVEFLGACDVYEKNRLAAREDFGPRCRAYKDFRELLEQKDIDAVVIATPDHWHAIVTVLACQAGKDVYVEKPLAHNIREGQAMVKAARQHNRIVQAGVQQRSAEHFEEMRRIIASGELGPVHFVRVWNYRNMFPRGIGRRGNAEVPSGLDWDFWLGPAPAVPFSWNRFLFTYRWFWDYSGGVITDFGTHRFDSVHQAMGADSPVAVAAAGRRFALDDDGEIPDVLQATYEYPGFVLSYEACVLNAHGVGGRTPGRQYYGAVGAEDRPNGMAFYGTNGALFADRLGFEIYPELRPRDTLEGAGGQGDPSGRFRMQRKEGSSPDSSALHLQNFIECVRTRRKPVGDIEIGHRSTLVAHLGNIALKAGRKIRWDSAKEEIVGDAEAANLLARAARKPWDLI